ncbi:hypothetical protein AYI69_g4731 [Smittium culicis]|uniref:Uncharacterized protein n=1 Tax=Smittium culicis TaxID=133412 RepID=A0A1R1YB95_9FUNG|nr:hypothetical protein AYI69_g4731 [Smittium culicis]
MKDINFGQNLSASVYPSRSSTIGDISTGCSSEVCGQPSQCSEHISPSQEAVRSVDSLPDLVLVVLDRPRYIPLVTHNIAQVGVLVGGVDFLALQGHISGQFPVYRHYPALGGIHSHFPSVRPFGYGIQCGL